MIGSFRAVPPACGHAILSDAGLDVAFTAVRSV
jgi:hypothetical protein